MAVCTSVLADSQRSRRSNVLLLQSYHFGMEWTAEISTAVRQQFRNKEIDLYEESLDTKRFPLSEVSENFAVYLQQKYRQTPLDVVIVADNNALAFMREHRETLFPKTALVFCGINNFSDSLIEGLEGRVTGVVEKNDYLATVRLIELLQPKARHIVVVTGSTETGKNMFEIAHQVFSGIEGKDFEWWNQLPLDTLLERCRNLRKNDAVILLAYNRDGAGRYIDRRECGELVGQASTAPVYCVWNIYQNRGLIGGVTARGEEQGAAAAKLALTYLKSGKLNPILRTSPNRAVISYPDLIQHNLDPRRLPADAVIVNEPAAYASHTPYFLALIIMLVLSAIVIGIPLARQMFTKKLRQQLLINELRALALSVLGVSLITILTVFTAQEFLSYRQVISQTRKQMINEHRERIKHQVDSLVEQVNIIIGSDERGLPIKTDLKQQIVRDMIAHAHSEFKNSCLFAFNTDGFMVSHPDPQLHGSNISDLLDINGNRIIDTILAAARNPGGGYCNYTWTKLQNERAAPKMTYARMLQEWNWVVASGFYLDDIDRAMITIQRQAKHKIIRHSVSILLVGLFALLLLELAFRITSKRMMAELNDLQLGIFEADTVRLARKFSIQEFATVAQRTVDAFNRLTEAEQDLRASHANFKSFFESSSNLIIICNMSGQIRYVNKALLDNLGWKVNALVGKNLQTLIPGEDLPAVLAGRTIDSMAPILKSDHTPTAVETRFMHGEWDGEPALFSVSKDISALQLSEQKFATAFQNNVALMIISSNRDHRIIEANKTFLQVMQLSETETVGKTQVELGLLEQQAYEQFISSIPASGQSNSIELSFTDRSGQAHIGAYRAQRLEINGEECLLTVINDITEKKALEGQLVQAQKLEAVGQLAAGIAHEINTPIQFVGDNLHFLQDSISDLLALSEQHGRLITLAEQAGLDPSEIQIQKQAMEAADVDYLREELPAAISQSLEGTGRVSKIVRAMKEFSHPGTTELSNANLNEAIETTITVAKNEWKYVADVETDFDVDLPMVPCLVSEFNQVVLNMIVNARDAIEETGAEGEKGLIRITTSRNAQWAVIRISDTGAGMPPDVQQRIFDPFYTTKEVGKGSGQGLAIAHNVIVNKHGGELDVSSKPGKGTTFEIRLPLQQQPEPTPEPVAT